MTNESSIDLVEDDDQECLTKLRFKISFCELMLFVQKMIFFIYESLLLSVVPSMKLIHFITEFSDDIVFEDNINVIEF
jgi:hypothetical protein